MKLSISSDLAAIEEEWRSFERRAECTPFQTFDWLSAWQRCIGGPAGVKPAIVAGRQDDGELLFLLPLAIERKRFSRRCVFLGHALCDYNAPLLAPEFTCAVAPAEFPEWWRTVEQFIRNAPGYKYDLMALDKMPERVGLQPNPLLALVTTVNPSAAYRTRLGKNWPNFYAEKRSSATRKRDRWKRKKLAQGGEVRLSAASDPNERQAVLRILFHQKGRVFANRGLANLFTRAGHSDFYLFVAAAARSLIHVSRLDMGSKCIATNMGLRFRNTYYHILTSYDDGPLKRFGPGTIHLHELMRYAIAEGLTHFDFTIGDEPYKLEWADEEVALHDHIAVAGWLGLPAAALIGLNPRVRRFFKENTPWLWRLAVRGKTIVGSLKSSKHTRSSP